MLKGILGGLVALFVLAVPMLVSAQTTTTTTTTTVTTSTTTNPTPTHTLPHPLVHSYNPVVKTQTSTGMMQPAAQARVDNWTMAKQDKLVCVEADKVGGTRTHLGCLMVNLAPRGSTDNMWAREFDAPLNTLARGANYNITYHYHDNGRWHQVTDMNDKLVNTTYNAI